VKGTIIKCLQELVENRFGKPEWERIRTAAGHSGPFLVTLTSDVDEAEAVELFRQTSRILELGQAEVFDQFGDYWVNDYAPRVYRTIYARYKSPREFLRSMDAVHVMVTQAVPNAKPPRFDYEEVDDKTLLVTYKSSRGLIDLFIGLARGVGKRFSVELRITKLSTRQVKIVFP
jgi:hypothetical protein